MTRPTYDYNAGVASSFEPSAVGAPTRCESSQRSAARAPPSIFIDARCEVALPADHTVPHHFYFRGGAAGDVECRQAQFWHRTDGAPVVSAPIVVNTPVQGGDGRTAVRRTLNALFSS
jgi:hypothetical protein